MLASVLYSRRVMRSKWTTCTARRRSFTNSWYASCISFGIIVYPFSPDWTCWCSAVGGVVGTKCCGVLEDMVGLVHPSSDPLRRRSLRERRSLCERRHFPLSGGVEKWLRHFSQGVGKANSTEGRVLRAHHLRTNAFAPSQGEMATRSVGRGGGRLVIRPP